MCIYLSVLYVWPYMFMCTYCTCMSQAEARGECWVTCSITLYLIPWGSFTDLGAISSNLLHLPQSAGVMGTHGYFRFLCGCWDLNSGLSSKSRYPLSHLSSPPLTCFSFLHLFHMCVTVEVRGQRVGVFPFHHVGSGDQTQLIRSDSNGLLLTRLASPSVYI